VVICWCFFGVLFSSDAGSLRASWCADKFLTSIVYSVFHAGLRADKSEGLFVGQVGYFFDLVWRFVWIVVTRERASSSARGSFCGIGKLQDVPCCGVQGVEADANGECCA
jgi:hypothetical protein